MPGVRRATTALVSLALAASGLACATVTPARVSFDERTDFSSFHTWDWHGRLEDLVEGRHVGGPDLDGLLGRLIERSLADHGYVRSRRHPDLFVTYDLEIRRRIRAVTVQRAPYLLSSMNSSPSYWIEGAETQHLPYLELRLAVAMTDSRNRVVWKSVLKRQMDPGQRPALGEAVASALAPFPDAAAGPPELWASNED